CRHGGAHPGAYLAGRRGGRPTAGAAGRGQRHALVCRAHGRRPAAARRAMSSGDLQAYLRAHGIAAELLRLDEPTPTVEAAARVMRTSVDRIAKSVVFVADGEAPLAQRAALVV